MFAGIKILGISGKLEINTVGLLFELQPCSTMTARSECCCMNWGLSGPRRDQGAWGREPVTGLGEPHHTVRGSGDVADHANPPTQQKRAQP